MAEYKPKFNAELPWPKVLELMNQLLDHKTDSAGSCGEIEYIIVELNDDTKETLNQLGVDINQIEDDFYDKKENWIDITSIVWGNIAWHYGQEIWYTGEEFIAWTDWERELETALKEMYFVLFATGLNVHIPMDMDITIKQYREKMNKWANMIKRIEGGTK